MESMGDARRREPRTFRHYWCGPSRYFKTVVIFLTATGTIAPQAPFSTPNAMQFVGSITIR